MNESDSAILAKRTSPAARHHGVGQNGHGSNGHGNGHSNGHTNGHATTGTLPTALVEPLYDSNSIGLDDELKANSAELWERGIDWPVVVWITMVHVLALV